MSKAARSTVDKVQKLESLQLLYKSFKEINWDLEFRLSRYQALHAEAVEELSAVGFIRDKCKAMEKMSLVEITHDKLQLGVLETGMIEDMCRFLNLVQCETIHTHLELGRLQNENEWLRTEFTLLNNKLSQMNEQVKNLQNERQQYIFLHQMCVGTKKKDEETVRDGQGKEIEIDLLFEAAVSDMMRSNYNLIIPYLNQGRYEVITALLMRLANEKDKDLKTLDRALLNYLQGVNLSFQNKPKNALVFLDEAYASVEAKYSSEHPILCCILHEMANCLIELKDKPNATKRLKQIVQIKSKHFGAKDETTLRAIVDLAELQIANENYNEVLVSMTEILTTLRKSLSSTDPVLVRAINFLAAAKVKFNKMDEALELMNGVFCTNFLRPDKPEITTVLIADSASEKLGDKLKKLYLPLEGPLELDCLRTLYQIFFVKNPTAATAILGLIRNYRT